MKTVIALCFVAFLAGIFAVLSVCVFRRYCFVRMNSNHIHLNCKNLQMMFDLETHQFIEALNDLCGQQLSRFVKTTCTSNSS